MNSRSPGLQYFRKVIAVLVAIELVYLVLVNAALWSPATQTLVNMARPEKFHASWERAWSWYPFRVHVLGLSANGQSRSQQWQLDASSASASVSVLPLAFKRVRVRNVLVEDVQYRQRPRLKEDKYFTRLIEHFPTIDGRQISAAITTPREKKRPWRITVDNARVTGSHNLWIYQASGSFEGELLADLSFQTQGGPFSLVGHKAELKQLNVFLNGDREVLSAGQLQGTLAFAPFVPRQNKGAKILEFLSLDMALDLGLNKLSFINLFLHSVNGLAVDGTGKLQGQLRYSRGDVISGTDVSITAEELMVDFLSHQINGVGNVDLEMGPQTKEQMELAFRFNDLQVHSKESPAPLLVGHGLTLCIGGNGRILVDPKVTNESRTVAVEVSDLAVPDLTLIQRYIPTEWPIQFYGGDGNLDARVNVAPASVSADIALSSTGADLGLRDFRFDTNLKLVVKLDNPSVYTDSTEISGSYIELSDARLHRSDRESNDSWNASLAINHGQFNLLDRQDTPAGRDATVSLLQSLGESNSSELLQGSSAILEFDAQVSSLAWLNVLFEEDYKLAVDGVGALGGKIHMSTGELAPGTSITVNSQAMAVDVLDYTSRGNGHVTLQVKDGKAKPDWLVDLSLSDADFKRSTEQNAYIEDVKLHLSAVIPNVRKSEEIKATQLNFKILSATVTDVSTFNDYLPADGSLRFTGGTASLNADIALRPDDAVGWLRMESTDISASAGEQSVRTDLALDVALVDGVPADMTYDISGSRLRLDRVRVSGKEAIFEEDYWSAQFELDRGHTTWLKPVAMDLEASLTISDSRPLVTMFENKGNPPDFVSRMLTVKDIRGNAALHISDEKVRILEAQTSSDKFEVAAKGLISREHRDAVLYMRYNKADALLRFEGDGKNLDIIGVKNKFEEFQPAASAAPESTLPINLRFRDQKAH